MKKNLFLMTLMVSVLAFSFVSCNNDNSEDDFVIEEPEAPSNEVMEAVDLGLPSGTRWATCNVGASAPEEYGDYFAWGEIDPDNEYFWSNYEWGRPGQNYLTKYFGKDGIIDNKTVLDPEDDAAHVNWGGNWRMPTKEEQDELREKCTWTWTTRNGINGCIVTGPNGNSIFLPASGHREDSDLFAQGKIGRYWSSSLRSDYPSRAYTMNFTSSGPGRTDRLRSYGQSVRPVCHVSICPSVELVSVSDVTAKSALISGKIISDGGAAITERGFCYSSTNTTPTITNAEKVTSTNGADTYSETITSLTPNTTYYVCAYATNSLGTAYSEVQTFTTAKDASSYQGVDFNGYEFVELGLPSGTLWATCNVGATRPERRGYYFAWGETVIKSMYSWSTYEYGSASDQLIKYYYLDRKEYLDIEDDAARANWGGSWRMPTVDEMEELMEHCTKTWTSLNGVNGYELVGPSGASIFLPACGYYEGADCRNWSAGFYWTSSRHYWNPDHATCVSFDYSKFGWYYEGFRYYGLSVRAVCSPTK